MDYNKLKQELLQDPEGIGYLALLESGAHNVIEEVLNQKQYTRYGTVGIDKTLIWLAKYGVLPRLRAASNGVNTEVASIAEIAILMVQNPNIASIDLGNTEVQTMFDVLVSAGVIQINEKDDLFAQSEVLKSRSEVLGLGFVSSGDIANVAAEVLGG